MSKIKVSAVKRANLDRLLALRLTTEVWDKCMARLKKEQPKAKLAELVRAFLIEYSEGKF